MFLYSCGFWRKENVSRLRELEYLNLALNNVECVEGLERCEALQKLDLTANFITDLTSLLTLQDLPNLTQLYVRECVIYTMVLCYRHLRCMPFDQPGSGNPGYFSISMNCFLNVSRAGYIIHKTAATQC